MTIVVGVVLPPTAHSHSTPIDLQGDGTLMDSKSNYNQATSSDNEEWVIATLLLNLLLMMATSRDFYESVGMEGF